MYIYKMLSYLTSKGYPDRLKLMFKYADISSCIIITIPIIPNAVQNKTEKMNSCFFFVVMFTLKLI